MDQEKIARQIRVARQNYFEYANKPGRWLSYRIRKEKESRRIEQLEDKRGTLIWDKEGIEKIATEFFTELYQEEKVPEERIKQYLTESDLPKLFPNEKEALDQEITIAEIEKAVR